MAISGAIGKKIGHPELAYLGIAILIGSYFGYFSLSDLNGAGPGYCNNQTIIITTLPRIIAGFYPSAIDKQGAGGTCVRINNLKVLGVTRELDLDYHIDLTDGRTTTFVSEIPVNFNQSFLPQVNSTINIVGEPYCDNFHAQELWHGLTCWEIHPLAYWSLSNTTITSGNFNYVPEPNPEP